MNKETQAFVLTMEECGELTQACSKVLRRNGDEKSLNDLMEEAGDVLCMLKLLSHLGYVTWEDLEERAKFKKLKLTSWSQLYD
jgi:NTP pyrophosphatase (non-canonical NTP hydrolase)